MWGEGEAHIFEWLPMGHQLLQLLLQLLARTDGLLVPGEIRQLLEACVREVLGEVLAAPLVGGEQLLRTVGGKVMTSGERQEAGERRSVPYNYTWLRISHSDCL